MAGSKHKMTGCARFLIFFIIFAPIAYFGASYYNGGDPVGDIKRLISGDESSSIEDNKEIIKLERIEQLEEVIQDLRDENARLRNQIKSLQDN